MRRCSHWWLHSYRFSFSASCLIFFNFACQLTLGYLLLAGSSIPSGWETWSTQSPRPRWKTSSRSQSLFLRHRFCSSQPQPSAQRSVSLMCCRVGVVHSVKLLSNRRCAFVNFAQQDSCVEAIRRFHVSTACPQSVAGRHFDCVLLLSCWCTCLWVRVLVLVLHQILKSPSRLSHYFVCAALSLVTRRGLTFRSQPLRLCAACISKTRFPRGQTGFGELI